MNLTWDGKERRKKKRYGVKESTLRYRKGGLLAFLKPPSQRFLLLNISETGAHFITREDVAVGQKMRLSIEAPSARGTLHAAGSVVWTRKSDEINAFRVGVQFRSLSGRAKGLIKNMLDSAILDNVEISTKVYLKEIERL